MHKLAVAVVAGDSSVHYLWPAKIQTVDVSADLSLSQTRDLAESAAGVWRQFLDEERTNSTAEMRNDEFFIWQRSRPELLRSLPEYAVLEATVLKYMAEYLGLSDGEESLRVVSWCSVQDEGAFHSPHTHTGEAAVAVFYARMAATSGSLLLLDPRGHIPPFGRRRELRPAAGTLVIFPSWLPHSAMPSSSAGDASRVIFAFNVGRSHAGSMHWSADTLADLMITY